MDDDMGELGRAEANGISVEVSNPRVRRDVYLHLDAKVRRHPLDPWTSGEVTLIRVDDGWVASRDWMSADLASRLSAAWGGLSQDAFRAVADRIEREAQDLSIRCPDSRSAK